MELSLVEIIVVLLIAFLVLGPVEMVKWADKLGRYVARLKHEVNNFKVIAKEEILREAEKNKLTELRQLTAELKENVEGLKNNFQKQLHDIEHSAINNLGDNMSDFQSSYPLPEVVTTPHEVLPISQEPSIEPEQKSKDDKKES